MDVDVQTQLYAQYSSANFGRGTTEKVDDLQAAVIKGLEIGSPRFKTFERAFVEIDGEVLEGKPKNPSADIYLGVNRMYSRDEVITAQRAEAERVENSPRYNSAQMSQQFALQALDRVIETFSKKDASAVFIAEPGGRSGEFIELREGETVFDSKGQQLWPQSSNKETVLRIEESRVLPASDVEREYTWEDEKFDNEMEILSRQL